MFVGHEKQKEIFRRAITGGRLAHAYIFSGIKGIGKGLFAHNLAKSVLCKNGSFFEECSCPSCTLVSEGTHPDLHIYGKAKSTFMGAAINDDTVINIENARTIAESAAMTPLVGKWKVYIIDGADALCASAQGAPAANALLKTLEEPSENTVFFLITDRYDAILPTIRSRAINIPFSPLTAEQIKLIAANIVPKGTFIDRAVSMSGGSVSKTLDILNEKFTDFTAFIKEGNMIKFAAETAKLKSWEDLAAAITFVYPEVLDAFKKTGSYSYCLLGYYLLDILKGFNYNINLDIAKADFSSKIIEVFGEKS